CPRMPRTGSGWWATSTPSGPGSTPTPPPAWTRWCSSPPRRATRAGNARSPRSRLARLAEGAARVGHERALGLHQLVQLAQPVAVGVHREARDEPDHLAQEPHHRADVVELHAQPRRPQIHDLEPGRRRVPAGPVGVAAVAGLLRLGPRKNSI